MVYIVWYFEEFSRTIPVLYFVVAMHILLVMIHVASDDKD